MSVPSSAVSSAHEKPINVGERPWLSAVPGAIPWLIPAALSIYIKYRVCTNGMIFHGAFWIVARSLGRPTRPSVSGLTLWERLSFFRADLLVGLLLVPLVLVVLCRYVPIRYGFGSTVLFSAAMSILLYCQLRAFDETGQFLSFPMFRAGITWGLQNASAAYRYLNLRALLSLIGAAIAVNAAWMWHRRARRRKRSPKNPVPQRLWSVATFAIVVCLLGLTAIAWASPLASTPFHQSTILWALRSLASRPDVDTRQFQGLSEDGLENRYRAMTLTPTPSRDARYWGKARGCNVIFLVMETAPAKILPADGDLADFPNLRRLRETSFVGPLHYTTYAETHQAIFSIFSSWYPSSLVDINSEHPDFASPGIMRKLSELGYDTAIYSPYVFLGEPDPDMYRSLGFRRQVYPTGQRLDWHVFFKPSLEDRIELDTAALTLLKRDLERDLAEGRRFAYLLAPQVSHGPWLGVGLKRGGDERDVAKQGRGLLAITDQYLGEIMQLLAQHNQLKQTVIVVVGDHGVRLQMEDPTLRVVFGDYSFHVPLVIYAPTAVDRMERIPWTTSHIDIAPTILALLGVESRFQQGTPIWDPRLANRTTYFFGRSNLGADGYHSNGRFYMWSHVSDTVYENTEMDFNTVPPVARNSSVYDQVTSSIRAMAGLEEMWTTRLSRANAVRNHLYDSPSDAASR